MDEAEEHFLINLEDMAYEIKEPMKVRCWIIEQRDKAIKVSKLPPDRLSTDTMDFIWLPRSQLEHISKDPPLPNGWIPAIITMPEWLAEEKKLV